MAMRSSEQLPDDVETLKTIIETERATHVTALAEIDRLRAQIRLLLAQRFGAKSERVATDSPQLGLFNEAEADAVADSTADTATVTTVTGHRRARGHRRPLPAHLPREEVVHDLADTDKRCPYDGTRLTVMGEETCEQLDIVPARIRVLHHRRLKYACPCCRQYVVTASMPAQPLPKSQASPGLLASIATAKYADAQPLYRQSTQFARIGFEASRQTLATWMVRSGGIGTPATRAEIIGGLKKQHFLIAQGKNIVPTETGLSLFEVLKRADPALVDPGVTAQLECLLDDVVIGRQAMVDAIDAVCNVAQRIIDNLKKGAAAGERPNPGVADGDGDSGRPPTPAMKRFADSIARQLGIRPTPGYTKSGSICRAFLDQHAPKKVGGEIAGEPGSKPASAAQILFAEKIAQENGIVIPANAKVSSQALSKWIELNHSTSRSKRRRKTSNKPTRSTAPEARAPSTRSRQRTADSIAASAGPARQASSTDTPLKIPYGNKEVAVKLGARYRAGGWYAPAGVDLDAFHAHGWL